MVNIKIEVFANSEIEKKVIKVFENGNNKEKKLTGKSIEEIGKIVESSRATNKKWTVQEVTEKIEGNEKEVKSIIMEMFLSGLLEATGSGNDQKFSSSKALKNCKLVVYKK